MSPRHDTSLHHRPIPITALPFANHPRSSLEQAAKEGTWP